MNDLVKYGESAEELIAAMHTHSFIITKTELARWHRAGLLPRPQRHSLGRGHGMVSVYPTGTIDQLRALCLIHRSEKRLLYVAWRLWWEGYSISIDTIRPFLEGVRLHWQRGIEEVLHLQAYPEQLLKVLDQSTIMRFSRKTLSGVRKRVGRKDFPTFMGVLVRIASGTFEGYEVHPELGIDERYIVEKGLGLLQARTNRLTKAGPWLTGDTGEVLQRLSSHLRHHPLGEDLSMMLEDDIAEAREEVRCFLSAFESISRTFDLMFSQGAFGFSVFADEIRDLRPQDQVIMLLFWRMFRSWGLGPNLDLMFAMARQWQQIWFPLFQGLEQLRNEVPATAEVLAPKQMGFALRRKLTMDGVVEILSRFAQYPDVKAFFALHPELSLLETATPLEETKQS